MRFLRQAAPADKVEEWFVRRQFGCIVGRPRIPASLSSAMQIDDDEGVRLLMGFVPDHVEEGLASSGRQDGSTGPSGNRQQRQTPEGKAASKQ